MPTSQALELSKEAEVDLVEIASTANPPVVRLIDFKKFKYEQAKKEQEEKKHAKETELKEVRMGPFVAENDLNVRMMRIKAFLHNGNKVKISIKFSGRQMSHPEFGHQLLKRILDILNDIAVVEREIRFEGRNFTMVLTPLQSQKTT